MKKILFSIVLMIGIISEVFSQCEVYKEDFSGNTEYRDSIFPYGKPPSTCLWAQGGASRNNGKEQQISVFAYTDFEIRNFNLDLPTDEYIIKCNWRDSVFTTTATGCTFSMFDETFGASCIAPNRIWVINDQLVHEVPGPSGNKKYTFYAKYKGPINSIKIGVAGACSIYPIDIWIDEISIIKRSMAPEIKIQYKILDSGFVQFFDSTLNADSTPPKWEFSDGQVSYDLSPIIYFDTTVNKEYSACLTRSNNCATDSVCINFNFGEGNGDPLNVKNTKSEIGNYFKINTFESNYFINNPESSEMHIEIYDTNGVLNYKQKISSKQNITIPFAAFNVGIHLIKLTTNKQSCTYKVYHPSK